MGSINLTIGYDFMLLVYAITFIIPVGLSNGFESLFAQFVLAYQVGPHRLCFTDGLADGLDAQIRTWTKGDARIVGIKYDRDNALHFNELPFQ